jgi:hypothetical protein
MLTEHAVAMAIEGSSLLAIAGPAPEGSTEMDAMRNLRNRGKKLIGESQTLLGQAAADGPALATNPAISRFHSAASLYITTLAGWKPESPGETAQVALINQAVKGVLDADHIRQMAPGASPSPAIEQLKSHAASMKTQGSEMVRRMALEGKSDLNVSANVTALATRGRELLDAADEVSRTSARTAGYMPGANNPGRFQDNRPVISGGTFGTADPRLGIYSGLDHPAGATAPKATSEPSSIPTYSKETTGSSGGLRPQ